MAKKAPGKHWRKGLTMVDLLRMFPDDETAERWFVETRWPDGVRCPKCGSDNVLEVKSRKPQPYRCRACRKCLSVKVGTLMENSKPGFQVWVLAFYLLSTELIGKTSMKLHRDLGMTQKSAWHLAHRIRETWTDGHVPFEGPVEVDESYAGGVEKNKHNPKKLRSGRGPVGKKAIVGTKDRPSNKVSAAVVDNTDQLTLQGSVMDHVQPGAKVYTDDHRRYQGLENHEAVKHSVAEYVNGMAHTNGIESFWSLLKRGYHGTHHRISAKHLQRYVNEFSGRHNVRRENTLDQMAAILRGMEGKRLRYKDLVG